MIELVRNASKTAKEVSVELRNSGSSTTLIVRSPADSIKQWEELVEAEKRAKEVGLRELLGLVRQKPTGVLLVRLLTDSVGGKISYSIGQRGQQLVIQSVCQMPLSSWEKNT